MRSISVALAAALSLSLPVISQHERARFYFPQEVRREVLDNSDSSDDNAETESFAHDLSTSSQEMRRGLFDNLTPGDNSLTDLLDQLAGRPSNSNNRNGNGNGRGSSNDGNGNSRNGNGNKNSGHNTPIVVTPTVVPSKPSPPSPKGPSSSIVVGPTGIVGPSSPGVAKPTPDGPPIHANPAQSTGQPSSQSDANPPGPSSSNDDPPLGIQLPTLSLPSISLGLPGNVLPTPTPKVTPSNSAQPTPVKPPSSSDDPTPTDDPSLLPTDLPPVISSADSIVSSIASTVKSVASSVGGSVLPSDGGFSSAAPITVSPGPISHSATPTDAFSTPASITSQPAQASEPASTSDGDLLSMPDLTSLIDTPTLSLPTITTPPLSISTPEPTDVLNSTDPLSSMLSSVLSSDLDLPTASLPLTSPPVSLSLPLTTPSASLSLPVSTPGLTSLASSILTDIPTASLTDLPSSILSDIPTGVLTSLPTEIPTFITSTGLPPASTEVPDTSVNASLSAPIPTGAPTSMPTAINTLSPTSSPDADQTSQPVDAPTSVATGPVTSGVTDETSAIGQTTLAPTGTAAATSATGDVSQALSGTTATDGASASQPTASQIPGTRVADSSVAASITKGVTAAPSKTDPVTSIRPLGTLSNSADWLDTTMLIAQSSASISFTPPTQTATGSAASTSATLPSGIPKVISPNDPKTPLPENSVTIQIGFLWALNWIFIANNTMAASQIFTYLPKALSYDADMPQNKFKVLRLEPQDTTTTKGYWTTKAICSIPQAYLTKLQIDIVLPNSLLYNNPDYIVRNLSAEIDPKFPLFDSEDSTGSSDDGSGGSSSSSSSSSGSGSDPFGNSPPTDTSGPKNIGKTAGIAAGALGLGAVYGIAMFVIARRYKRKKQLRNRRDSVDRMESPEMSYVTHGSPALVGGALAVHDEPRQDSPTNRNSLLSDPSSGRSNNISNPVAAENSLGWN